MARRKEPHIPDALLDQLLSGANAKTAFEQGGLLDALKKALAETPTLVELAEKNRVLPKPRIPAFPLTCSGYQKGFATLLREKVARIQREKAKADTPRSRSTSKKRQEN